MARPKEWEIVWEAVGLTNSERSWLFLKPTGPLRDATHWTSRIGSLIGLYFVRMSQTAEAGFSCLTHGVITFSMASFVFTFVFPQPKDSKTFKTSLLVSVQPGYAKVKFTVAVQYSNSHLACRGGKCRNHGLPLWSYNLFPKFTVFKPEPSGKKYMKCKDSKRRVIRYSFATKIVV